VKRSEGRTSKTAPETAFLVKYLAAFIALVPAALSSEGLFAYPARIVIIVPLALWGFFCLTATEVQACEQVLKYRRFLFWKQIPYEQIVECKNSWNPWFGYVELVRFVPPWGKIYFVTMRPAFTGNPKELVASINARREGIEPHVLKNGGPADETRKRRPSLYILLGFVGIIISLVFSYLFPEYDRPIPSKGFPIAVAMYLKFLNAAVSWPWALGTIAILTAAIMKFRSKDSIWILALGAGTILGHILATRLR